MKHLLLSISLLVALVSAAAAQPIVTEKGKQSDELALKLRKIDLLNQILPLVLTKQQINELLPAIERARTQIKAVLAREDEELAKLGPQIDDTLTKAIDKQAYPSRDFLNTVASKTREMATIRQIAMGKIVEDMQTVVDRVLNEGQKKALIGSFDAAFVDPTKKPADVTADQKKRFYIERILLDPLTRELLIDIASKMS